MRVIVGSQEGLLVIVSNVIDIIFISKLLTKRNRFMLDMSSRKKSVSEINEKQKNGVTIRNFLSNHRRSNHAVA